MQALWMVLAAFFFAGMAVCVKFASTSFSSFELVFFRGLVSLAFMAVVLRASGTPWRTPVPLMHLTRSIIGATSLGAWFYAIAHLPVATAMTLNYMSGVWIAAFIVGGALLMDEEIEALGWAGMAVIVVSGLIATFLRTRALPNTPAEAH